MRARLRWILVVAVVLVASAILLARTREQAEERVASPGARLARAVPPRASPSVPAAPAPSAPAPLLARPPPPTAGDAEPAVDPGYPVNLERIRAQIPGNRYWIDQAPTNDPEVLRRRDADAATWNVLYGKVLSGTGTAAEIGAWFDHRRQVSEDAIEFAGLVLADHGSELPDRDRGLLELAIDMHRTRLSELPREEAEARARKAEQDRRRAEWQRRSTP